MPTTLDFSLAHLDKSRQLTLAQLKDIPDDQLARQLPGAPNHFLGSSGISHSRTNTSPKPLAARRLRFPPGMTRSTTTARRR